MKLLPKVLLKFGIAIVFISGTFLVGEFHPFSHFYMYNNFPNWSYVFYFTEENGKLIPAKELNTDGIKLGYLFYTVAQNQHIPYGNGIESKKQLNSISKKMMEEVLSGASIRNKTKKIKLVRTFYSFQNNSIQKQSDIMYEKEFE